MDAPAWLPINLLSQDDLEIENEQQKQKNSVKLCIAKVKFLIKYLQHCADKQWRPPLKRRGVVDCKVLGVGNSKLRLSDYQMKFKA